MNNKELSAETEDEQRNTDEATTSSPPFGKRFVSSSTSSSEIQEFSNNEEIPSHSQGFSALREVFSIKGKSCQKLG